MTSWAVEYWLSDSEMSRTDYSAYWNDEQKEKEKEWYILDGDFSKMERYLRQSGLPSDLLRCVEILKGNFNCLLGGVGIDLAAGNGWAIPHLFKAAAVDRLYCLEYSKHRLLKMVPEVLEHYQVPKEKVVLVFGSFYDLHLGKESMDFVFLSQSFHHADRPDQLLSEVHRVLKPKGAIVIIGEHAPCAVAARIKHAVKFFLSLWVPTAKVPTLHASFEELFPVEPTAGDHYYRESEYRRMFSKYAFQIRRIRNRRSGCQSFVLVKAPA